MSIPAYHPIIEGAVSFTVPYLTPPSVNHHTKTCYYIGKDGFMHTGRKLTREAKAFKDAVAIFAGGRTVAPLTNSERDKVKYKVKINVVLGPRARLDCDNSSKVGIDALQAAGVIHSDSKVIECVLTIDRQDRFNPRTEFIVSRME